MAQNYPRWKFNKSLAADGTKAANIKHPQAASYSPLPITKRVRIVEEQNITSTASVGFPGQKTYPKSCLKQSVVQPSKPTFDDVKNWRAVQCCRSIACRKCRRFPLRRLHVPGDLYRKDLLPFLDDKDTFEWDWKKILHNLFYFLIALVWVMIMASLLRGPPKPSSSGMKVQTVQGHPHGDVVSSMVARVMEAEG